MLYSADGDGFYDGYSADQQPTLAGDMVFDPGYTLRVNVNEPGYIYDPTVGEPVLDLPAPIDPLGGMESPLVLTQLPAEPAADNSWLWLLLLAAGAYVATKKK